LPTEPLLHAAELARGPAPLSPPPRRAIATIVATVLGLVLLFSFKTPESPPTPSRPATVARGPSVPNRNQLPAPPAAPNSRPTAAGGGQIDGDVIGTRFGDVQVRLIEAGGRISEVQALQMPYDRRRSLEISQFVAPILESEALQAQSAQIDTVSGATYTSEAYRESLQSALDHAHG
jgi:uncharacterized protein with FMN-binding domain